MELQNYHKTVLVSKMRFNLTQNRNGNCVHIVDNQIFNSFHNVDWILTCKISCTDGNFHFSADAGAAFANSYRPFAKKTVLL